MNARGRLKVPVMPSPPAIAPSARWRRYVIPAVVAVMGSLLTSAVATTAARIGQLARTVDTVAAHDRRLTNVEADMSQIKVTLAAIKQGQDDSNERLKRIENKIDR